MSKFFIRNITRLLLIFHFSIIYSIIFIISFFFKKKIRFINNVYSEIGQITWIDGLLRKRHIFKNKDIIICLNYGSHVANQFIEDLKVKKLNEMNIYLIHNLFIVNFLKPLCLFKNNFFNSNYNHPSYKEYQNLDTINWFGDIRDKYERDLRDFFNLKEDDWFVCFFARDSLYDELYRPKMTNGFNIRNSNVNTFDLAMKFIADKGGHAIRIGSSQKKTLDCADSIRIHDYAFNRNKNPKIDALLPLLSKFIIGTSSGIIDIGVLNDVPLGFINNNEYILEQGFKYGSFIPKLYYKSDQTLFTYKEYIEKIGRSTNMVQHQEKINKLNLSVRDNSNEDILELTQDFYNKYILKKRENESASDNYFNKYGLKIDAKFFKKYNL